MHQSRDLLEEQLRSELEDALGEKNVIDDETQRRESAIDQYWLPFMWRAAGNELKIPSLLLTPTNTAQVSETLKICSAYKVPVVTRGGGSGTQGGATTLYGGVVLDTRNLNSVQEVNETSLTMTAEAGVGGMQLEAAANERGLMVPHYPASAAMATLGGYLAARGSGVMSTKYGKAEDIVLSAEVVTADGTVVESLSVPNHANGPGLLQLFVGSEGTLGVITRATMRLEPLPEVRLFQVFEFPDVATGLEAGRRIMTRRLDPTVVRLYDAAATERSLRGTGHDLTGVNMIVMVDGYADIATVQLQRIINTCTELGGVVRGEEEGRHWWDHRYDFYRPPHQPSYPQMYGTVETVTTFDNIAALYEAKRCHITEKYMAYGAQYTAHFSHWYPWGVMIYDRFYIDNAPEDPQACLRLHNRIWAECSRINLAHGAPLNEHHGIGFKLGWLMRQQSEARFKLLMDLKRQLDPKGILNPGKLGFGVW